MKTANKLGFPGGKHAQIGNFGRTNSFHYSWRRKLDGFDRWIDQHPGWCWAVGTVFVLVMAVVATNLALARPWF